MMGVIVLLHRWLGVAFCFLFAMWFATGIVMHFVPFPSLTEAERFAGLAPVDEMHVRIEPPEAAKKSGIKDVNRIRLIQRSDGPVYVVSGASRLQSIRAFDGADAKVRSPDIALAAAADHARRRGLNVTHASVAELANYDQWSVPNGFDRHRPLFRVTLEDLCGTEIYVSSITGEIVLDTTRRERWWNLVGSVLHWIYPAMLRSNWSLWDRVVWTLSLLALVLAVLGSVLGIVRIRVRRGYAVSPYRGWRALHHFVGLGSMAFVLTWIFSGWLSMDHGRLFSRGQLTSAEAEQVATLPDWKAFPIMLRQPKSASVREIEWFAFNGRFHRRDWIGFDRQLLLAANGDLRDGALNPGEIQELMGRLAAACGMPLVLARNDDYPVASAVPGAPVYRAKCGEVWFDVDGANGNFLQRLDPSRRTYLRLYTTLHTLNVPFLAAHSTIRSAVIVTLCSIGLLFSMTGIVIGWRRLRHAGV